MRVLLSSLYLLGVIFVVSSSPVVDPLRHGAEIKPIDSTKPAKNGSEETSFFHMMNQKDQMWFMKESLKVHLGDTDREPADPVPEVLKEKMLNGKIPSNFQKAFSQWLVDTYQFTDNDIRALLQEKEVCGPSACTDLPGLGQTCCPFG